MALRNSYLIIFSFLISSFTEARINLPELLTKQSVSNIRLLTKDGKFTYYQKRSGSLLFATNYKVQEILKSEIGTEYTIYSTSSRKKMVILQNPNFHNFYSLRAKEKIFLLNYGESSPSEIGLGISPVLHLNDSWISFFDPYTKVISFENTTNSSLKFSIKLNNRLNPYFVPQVVMSDDNTVYYTDLSEVGIYGVLEFKRNLSKSEIIYKAKSPMMKIELCINQGSLIAGEFGFHFSPIGSSVSRSLLPMKDFSKRENLYSSQLNDLGHLVCDFDKDNIALIQNTGTMNSPSFDIVNLNTNTKKITPLSEMKTISNIINMDGTLLTQEKGKYYIVKGETDFKNIDTLKIKAKEPDSKESKESEESNDE